MRGCRPAILIRGVLSISVLLSTGAMAQTEYYDYLPAEEEIKEGRTALFTPKYIDVRQLQSVLGLLNADVEINSSLNLIAARSADEDELETIRRIVETLDVAPETEPNVELTAYILLSSPGETAPADIPAELGEVIDRLAARFDFGTLRLLDSIFLRVGGGSGGRIEGSLPAGSGAQTTTAPLPGGLASFQFHFDSATVFRQGDAEVVRLDALTFAVIGENPAGVHRALLRTDVEIIAGEKAMVGKATPRGGDDTLFLLVEAEVHRSE